MTGYATLGDIAKAFEEMKADGMTLESIRYALGRVYGDEMEAERAQRRAWKERTFHEHYGMGSQRLSDPRPLTPREAAQAGLYALVDYRPPASELADIGTAVHEALERYYGEGPVIIEPSALLPDVVNVTIKGSPADYRGRMDVTLPAIQQTLRKVQP
ncbi:hypothetical protein SEA_MABODAMACA_52 [Microbacterium phage Mabodamaca]|uniref:Uncharacterized protein n=1 Tax=Microbacterium phage Mabodamaca TaxID=3078574 RepID=A0AA96NE23_9CAUD|nr:hypothetical protein SEA_MABODAMACA_52 [Microbacterium phage Mabodamaca]